MNIYGVKYSVGFVTSVCTYPEYTGHGIMKRLMIQSLIRMRDAHKSFALLYPYSIPLYRGLGWEIISNKMTYTIKDTQIPRKLNEPGYVRRVSWDDKEFKELHTKFAEKTHGCLYRNNLAWEEYWRWDEDDTSVAIYYSKDDVPYGYMVYMISSDVMHVKEMIYLNREAQLGLWEFIHAHDSMIDEVRGNNYYSEPIAFELDDSDIKETIRPYTMGRIIDIRQFFAKYACDPDEPSVCIRFYIEDDLLAWNNGYFTYLFDNGKCIETEQQPDYEVSMSIGTLTTLMLGYKTAEKLHVMDKIQASDEAVEHLDECPLRPFIIFGIASTDLAVPVVTETYFVHLFPITGDVFLCRHFRMLSGLDSILFCRQSVGIVAHRMQNVEALQAFVTGINIRSDITEWVAYM